MNNKPSKNFDQIKPFLRMLEGSIDDARRRRLGEDAPSASPQTPVSNGQARNITAGQPDTAGHPVARPLPMQGNQPVNPAPVAPEPDRPLRATPIKPKQSLHPSTGYRPTGS
jgi:hypothetical protein